MNQGKKVAIHLEGCPDAVVDSNIMAGFDVGVKAINSARVSATRNKIFSAEAIALFEKIDLAAAALETEDKAQILAAIEDLKSHFGEPSATEKYIKLVGVVADHVSLVPLVASMAKLALNI